MIMAMPFSFAIKHWKRMNELQPQPVQLIDNNYITISVFSFLFCGLLPPIPARPFVSAHRFVEVKAT